MASHGDSPKCGYQTWPVLSYFMFIGSGSNQRKEWIDFNEKIFWTCRKHINISFKEKVIIFGKEYIKLNNYLFQNPNGQIKVPKNLGKNIFQVIMVFYSKNTKYFNSKSHWYTFWWLDIHWNDIYSGSIWSVSIDIQGFF